MALAVSPGTQMLGLWRNEVHEYGWSDGEITVWPMPSVTGIIKTALDKPALTSWVGNMVAAFAVERAELIADMRRSGGTEATAKWVSAQARRKRDDSAALGSDVHLLCDAIARGENVVGNDAQKPYLMGFRAFLEERQPQIEHSEFMVANLTVGYAGTGDLIAKLADLETKRVERWCIDTKTGNYIYPEHGWQLAAYAKGEFIGKPGDPVKYRLPPCTRFGVLHLRPGGYRLVEYVVTRETWEAFKAAVTIWGWVNGEAKTIMKGARQ